MEDNVSDLEEFKTVDQLRKELKTLKIENRAAMATINKLLKDLNQKSEEIQHLQSLVAQTVPVIKKQDSKIISHVPAEEEIAVLQLEKLLQAARVRSLTLEETRAYDLLVKNKRLSQDESTINLSKPSYRDVSDTDLLQLASSIPDEPESK